MRLIKPSQRARMGRPICQIHILAPSIQKSRPSLTVLIPGLKSALRRQLVGIYLYGSLIAGDFDPDISDIDLVVVLKAELNDDNFQALQRLHAQVLDEHPGWLDRLELAYISRDGLRDFRRRASTIGIISPGEPFHRLQAGVDWLISWYPLLKEGIALYGPGIETLLGPITTDEYLAAVKAHLQAYRGLPDAAPRKRDLSYIILTVARGLFTLRHRRAGSKRVAAAWARRHFPAWSALIDQAWSWRQYPPCDASADEQILAQTADYVDDMLSKIDKTAAPQGPSADSAGSMPAKQ